MRLPAALERWAAEHNQQLSDDTIAEVRAIAEVVQGTALGERSVHELGDDVDAALEEIFDGPRLERATTLIQVVASWARAASPARAESAGSAESAESAAVPHPVEPDEQVEIPLVPPSKPAVGGPAAPAAPASLEPPGPPLAHTSAAPIAAPAFLRSDKVDEEDDVRLYGPRFPWKAALGLVVSLALLAGVGLAGWYWFTQRDTDDASGTTVAQVDDEPTAVPTAPAQAVEPTPVATESAEPTPAPAPTPLVPSSWADTAPILNSGSALITASTYNVSPANRAVLTGHTAAITGIVVSDDGRVLTSGADRRLVDWGADVTLASPDVLNVPAPLTVLTRTADQRMIAGDTNGNITVIDLVNTVDPIVVPVHDVAVSAAAELADGRLAIASVDGPVAVFSLDTPDDRLVLAHDVEVTAVEGLDDGRVATAAVDGIVRLWSVTDEAAVEEISTLDRPVTALIVLSDGQLATASVGGEIHIVPPQAGASESLAISGHIGAVRAVFELELDGTRVLASGGDDTTIRLWDLTTGDQLRVLDGHGDIISGLEALPDGRLVSTSGDGTGRVWDLTVPPGPVVIPPHDWNLSAIRAWSNDQFVTGGVDGKVMLASTAETSEPTLITRHDAPIVGLSVLQSGDVVSLDASSVMRVSQVSVAAAPGTEPIEITVAAGATALDARAGLGVVTGHADGSVRFHDFAEEVTVVEAHGSGVNDVAALSNGMVVSAGQDMTVRIIDFENPATVPVFDLHSAPVDVVIELADGRIASAGSDGIYVWSLDGLAQDHIRLNGSRSRTISLVDLGNGRLVSTGQDGRIRVWDLSTPEDEPVTAVDIPGIVNPHLIQAENGLFVAGAARGYVVFSLS